MMDEDYKVRQIPDNFGSGINVAGMHFGVIFLIEGIVFAVLLFFISFAVLSLMGMNDIGQMLGICLVFAAIALFIGVKGINDEPITTFAKNLSYFNKNRRTAYYNPRIKLEAKSVRMQEKSDAEIPREKIMAALNKYKEAIDKKQQEKAKAFEEANAFDKSNMFFEDDIGIIKRPNQYMSKEEIDSYDKKKQKISSFRKNKLNAKD